MRCLQLSVLVVVLACLAAYKVEENSVGCEEVGLCVECAGLHQPWLAFPAPHSAYLCYNSCRAFSFHYVDTLGNSDSSSLMLYFNVKMNHLVNSARKLLMSIVNFNLT